MTIERIIERCQNLFDDLSFEAVQTWKAAEPGRKAIGYMPIYVPREIIHAAGMLPVGILGGGDQLEVIQGDAYYQSYICRIPRSTVELGGVHYAARDQLMGKQLGPAPHLRAAEARPRRA